MRPIKIAIDVEGGDNGSEVLCKGILEAKAKSQLPFVAHVCGNEKKIRNVLKSIGIKKAEEKSHGFVIEHCGDTITLSDLPSRVWKTKANAPIIRCVSLQKQGVVDASISAGNTGVLLGAAMFVLGRVPGITRPALAAFLPTTKQRPVLVLDVGANLSCRVEHLVDFGLLGFSYVKKYLGIKKPEVRLLNIGKEPNKGTPTIIDAGISLAKCCKGYKGFIEGSGVLLGEADIVVCDGFAGNVLLKSCESFHLLVRSIFATNAGLLKDVSKSMNVLKSENYGAVPFLGINGIVLKAHGSSGEVAIANAIVATCETVKKKALCYSS